MASGVVFRGKGMQGRDNSGRFAGKIVPPAKAVRPAGVPEPTVRTQGEVVKVERRGTLPPAGNSVVQPPAPPAPRQVLGPWSRKQGGR